MRKTEEEILISELLDKDALESPELFNRDDYELYLTAMQTFAQQESEAKAVGFAEWKDKNTKESPYVVGKFEYKKGLYTTAQLYAIYLKNKF